MLYSVDIFTYFLVFVAMIHPLEQAIHLQHARRQGDPLSPQHIILHAIIALAALGIITWYTRDFMANPFPQVATITTVFVLMTQGYHMLTRSRLASTQPSMQGWINQHIRPFSLLRPEVVLLAILLGSQATALSEKITLTYLYISLVLTNSVFLLFAGKARAYISTNDACIVGRFLGIIVIMFAVFIALSTYHSA
jgi:hypothetical protein